MQYRRMRARITAFQRFCRGYIGRQRYRRRLFSIIKLQSHFRRLMAKRRVNLLRIEYQKRMEAERLRKEEEARLKQKMKAAEARKEAERLHQVCVCVCEGGVVWVCVGVRVWGWCVGVGDGVVCVLENMSIYPPSPSPLPLPQERLARIEQEKYEELEKMRMDAAAKREEIERKERDAEMMRSMPVDDSKIVEQMFGFLPEGEHVSGEGES